jgi:hypothetical protein
LKIDVTSFEVQVFINYNMKTTTKKHLPLTIVTHVTTDQGYGGILPREMVGGEVR